MDFSSLPAELRALPQWVVWRPVLREGKVTKPPYRSDNCSLPADVGDPRTWGTFEAAAACYAANASALGGVGFVLTEADPYTVIDLDPRAKVAEHHVGYRLEFEQHLLSLATYAEVSPSGEGLHVWMRARTGSAGRHLKQVGAEAYCWQRFLTCTGRRVTRPDGSACGEIADCQAFVDWLGLAEAPPVERLERRQGDGTDGLSDAEVVDRACAYVSWFRSRWRGHDGCAPGEWSHTFVAVLGVLDRVCGDPEQVRRIVYASPMVTEVDPAGSGESRPAKARRLFDSVMARVRAGNRGQDYFVEHGREQWASVLRERGRLAAEVAAEAERRAAEMLRREREAAARGVADLAKSTNAADVLARFSSYLSPDVMLLRPPPGVMGQFVCAARDASRVPSLKFALPATLATMAGICARAWEQDSGSALAMNYIMVAPSSTGKGQSMRVWQRFLAQATERLPRVTRPVNRLLLNTTASVQGIVPELMDVPCCAWFIEEASGQFNAMSRPKTTTDENLRNFYNELYDASERGQVYHPPRSVAGKNAGFQPIPRLCVSTFWTTTPEKFELTDGDIRDGFASRVVFVHHDGPGGDRVRTTAPLPDELCRMLVTLLCEAQSVDESYKLNPQTGASRVRLVDTRAVDAEAWDLTLVCDRINREAIQGTLPKVYQLLSRLPANAGRLAALLAVVDNPWTPAVRSDHLRWSYEYLLQNALGVLAAMDTGEVGDSASDEYLAAKRLWEDMVKKGGMRDGLGVPRSKFITRLCQLKPFRSSRIGPYAAATQALSLFIKNQQFSEHMGQPNGRGRVPHYIMLVGEDS